MLVTFFKLMIVISSVKWEEKVDQNGRLNPGIPIPSQQNLIKWQNSYFKK